MCATVSRGSSKTLTYCFLFQIEHSNMRVSKEFIAHDRVVGFRDSVPQQLRESEVTDVALNVFNNFVEQIARISPPTAKMKERRQSCASQLRRSQRFVKHLDARVEPQAPLLQPITAAPPSKPTFQKVCRNKPSLVLPEFPRAIQHQ